MTNKAETHLRGTSFERGHLIILDDCDRPEAKMIAVIEQVDGERLLCSYLSAASKFDSYQSKWMANTRRATPVERFGVRIVAYASTYRWEKVGESTATYPDGKPRPWQDPWTCWHRARPRLLKLAKQAAKMETADNGR